MLEKLPNNFRMIRKIGQGGMAIIYLVLNKENGQKYAIKILNANRKDSHADKKRFKQEIELTKQVISEKVIKVYGYKWDEDIQYILMEYVEGQTLKEYLDLKKRLTPDEAVDITMQLAEGFSAIHKAGIIHRDIKPSNIIISGHGEVKIIDFGIAISNDTERLTKADSLIGSPHYLAPELSDLDHPSKRCDIYSLGIMFYEMIMGDAPHKGNIPAQIVKMHKLKDVPQVNKTFQNIPQSLSNIIIKSTSRNKHKRYKDMKEFYEDLRTCLDISRAYEKPFSLTDKKSKLLLSKINSNAFLLILFALFTSILIISIIILLTKGSTW